MRHSRLGNYIVPGLTSHLVGGAEFGKVRVFSTERSARDFITPHSHRFDFTSLVLSGTVHNTLYIKSAANAEAWCLSTIGQVCGENGLLEYVHTRDPGPSNWHHETYTYGFRPSKRNRGSSSEGVRSEHTPTQSYTLIA
jgi:hypothetical protein